MLKAIFTLSITATLAFSDKIGEFTDEILLGNAGPLNLINIPNTDELNIVGLLTQFEDFIEKKLEKCLINLEIMFQQN